MTICEHDFIPTFPDSSQYYCTKCNLGGTACAVSVSRPIPALPAIGPTLVITEPYTIVKNNKIVSVNGVPVAD